MKKIILLLIPIFISSLFSDWSKIGNKEILTFPVNILRFSITEDQKQLYLIDSLGVFYQYDLQNGKEIKNFKIPNFTANYNDDIYISNDNLTFVHIKKNFTNSYYLNFSCFIYQISNNICIDTLYYEFNKDFNTNYYYDGDAKFADYIFNKQILIFHSDVHIWSVYSKDMIVITGIMNIFKKEKQDWINNLEIYQAYNTVFYDNNLENIFFSGWRGSYKYISPNSYLLNSSSAVQYFYNFKNAKHFEFHGYESNNYEDNYHFNSGYFLDSSRLLLCSGSKFFIFDINRDFKYRVFNQDIDDSLSSFFIKQSYKTDVFYTFSNNRINLYLNNFNLISKNKIDEFVKINTLKNLSLTDEILLFDGLKQIIKIKFDQLFPLFAEFNLPQNKFMIEQEIKPENVTYGENVDYEWDFGDGTFSKEKNPIKIYTDTGTYTIKLKAKKNSIESVKERSIKIVPKFTADFEYTISGDFPKYIKYKNTSTGKIDSFIWFFDSNTDTLKNVNDTTRVYTLTGDYSIKLVAYANGISSSKEVLIRLDFDEGKIDTNIIKKEYLINNIGNESLKGFYEGNDRIMNLTSSDSTKQIGLLNNSSITWNKNLYNKTYSLLRRENGVFTFLDSNRVVNLKLSSEESDTFLIPDLKIFVYINSFKNKIQYLTTFLSKSQDIYDKIFDLNEKNIPVYESKHQAKFVSAINLINQIDYDKIFVATDVHVDTYHAFFTKELYEMKYYFNNRLIMNTTSDRNFPLRISKIERFNDSLLFTSHTDSILRFNINPSNRIDSQKRIYPSQNLNYRTFKHRDFKFSYFHILNDSLLVLTGNKKNKPAFLIINKDMELIKEYVIEERIGSFNHISQATNNRLLFSGYCYKEFGKKQPYFALIEDAFFPLNDRIIDTIPQDTIITKIDTINIYCYPNPASEKLYINVGLSKPANYNLKIYNSQGLQEFEVTNQIYNNTIQKIEVNLERFSNGMYFFELEINGIKKTEKFIYFRKE